MARVTSRILGAILFSPIITSDEGFPLFPGMVCWITNSVRATKRGKAVNTVGRVETTGEKTRDARPIRFKNHCGHKKASRLMLPTIPCCDEASHPHKASNPPQGAVHYSTCAVMNGRIQCTDTGAKDTQFWRIAGCSGSSAGWRQSIWTSLAVIFCVACIFASSATPERGTRRIRLKSWCTEFRHASPSLKLDTIPYVQTSATVVDQVQLRCDTVLGPASSYRRPLPPINSEDHLEDRYASPKQSPSFIIRRMA